MSVASLSDHVVDFHRSTEAKVGTKRRVVRSWSLNAAAVDCTIQNSRELRAEVQGGEITVGEYWCYIDDVTTDVVEGDVLKTISGSHHPLIIEVVEVDNFRSHHIEVRLTEWRGKLA